MGLFDRIFGSNKTEMSYVPSEDRLKAIDEKVKVSFDKEIDTIILVLKNLGLLDSSKIENIINEQGFKYDKSVLNRLRISTSEENINYLHKYFDVIPIGYGSVRLDDIRKKLEKMASNKTKEGKNSHEVVEELIDEARFDIKVYEDKLKSFNSIVGNLEKNSNSESEIVAMMDYWTEYYKENEFGYPINISEKVNSMIRELKSLEFGGYGEDEIKNFRVNCNKMIEEGKLKNEKVSDTYNRINTTLFLPKKNKYLADVEILKRKIQMIKDSPTLNEDEINQNIEETITGFNELYGHIINPNEKLEEMIDNLKSLQYGGYGKYVIDEFQKLSLRIIDDGKRNNKSVNYVISKIKVEYNHLLRRYDKELDKLNSMINQLEDFGLSTDDKKEIRKEYIQEFKDEMGHPIDCDARIEDFVSKLRTLDHGGYGEARVYNFKDQCYDKIRNAKNEFDLVDVMKDIYELYKNMLVEYKDKYDEFRNSIERINNDDNLTEEEKENEKEELDRRFRLDVGCSMDFDSVIDEYVDNLRNLPGGGYGNTVIDEFVEVCHDSMYGELDSKLIYDRISRKANILISRYINNLYIYDEWKNKQLEEYVLDDKEEYSKELDKKIKYMLSLSPKELTNYFIEDDKKVREECEKHNFIAEFKYLAREEAKNNNNDLLYDKRLADLENGVNPYSREELSNAKDKLEEMALFEDDELDDELRVYTTVDILDKTLFKQLSVINTNHNNKHTK